MDQADTQKLRELFTPDAMLVHMTGYTQSIDEWAAGIENQEFVYYRVIEETVRVELIGSADAALVGCIITGYRPDGSGQAWPLRLTQRYVLVQGKWLCSRSQVTFNPR